MANPQTQLQRGALQNSGNNNSIPASPQSHSAHGPSNVHAAGVHPGSVLQQPAPYNPYYSGYYSNPPFMQQQQMPGSAMQHAFQSQQHGSHPQQQPTPPSLQSQQNQQQQQQHQQQLQQQNQHQQQQQQQHQQISQSTISPVNARKRRASELDEGTLAPSMTIAPYSMAQHQGLMTPQAGAGNVQSPNMMTPGQSGPKQDPSNSQKASSDDAQSPSQPSSSKKGRTNTPWTPQEEHRLKQMRDEGTPWSKIAKTFPQRTEGSVKKHFYKDMHYEVGPVDDGSFSTALTQAIKDYEANRWKEIGKKLNKSAKQCEQYAKDHGLAQVEDL